VVVALFLGAVVAFEIIAFALSYHALTRLAVRHGVTAEQAWMIPALVDGGILLGSLGVIRALIGGRSTVPYWVVTVCATATSWALNVAYAPRTIGGFVMATIPPVAQLVALELGMAELRAAVTPANTDTRTATGADTVTATIDTTPPPPPPAPRPVPATPTPAITAAAPRPDLVTLAAAHPAPPTPARPAVTLTKPHTPPPAPHPVLFVAGPDTGHDTTDDHTDNDDQDDDGNTWAQEYKAAESEAARVALTRRALAERPRLTGREWAQDIRLGETRARNLLRAARA